MSVKSSSSARVLRSSAKTIIENQNITQNSSIQGKNISDQTIETSFTQDTMEIDNVTDDNITLEDITPQNFSSSLTPSSSSTNNNITNIINNTIENIQNYDNNAHLTIENSIHAIQNNNASTVNSNKGKNKISQDNNQNKEILQAVSINKRDFNKVSNPNLERQNIPLNTKEPFNSQSPQQTVDHDIIDISDVVLNANQNQYIAFSPLNSFSTTTISELKLAIRKTFNKKFPNAFEGYLGIQNFKEPILEHKRLNTVRILDIPHTLETQTFLELVESKLGKINSYEEIIKKSSNQNNNFRKKDNRKPYFKQFKIEFASFDTIEKIITEDIWAIVHENACFRLVPNDNKADEYIRRTQCCYKITGIPVNLTLNTLKPFLNKIHARTCTFTHTHPRRLTKVAYVYLDIQNYVNKNRSAKLFNSNIHVLLPKTECCTVCGSSTHTHNSCSEASNLQETLKRLDHQIPLSTDDWNNRYGQVIHKNPRYPRPEHSSANNTNQQTPPKGHKGSSPNQKPPYYNNNQFPQNNYYNKEIEDLKKIVEQQNRTITKLTNTVELLNSKLIDNTKELITIKEQQIQNNIKSDIVINKLDDFITTSSTLNTNNKPHFSPRRKRRSNSPPKDNHSDSDKTRKTPKQFISPSQSTYESDTTSNFGSLNTVISNLNNIPTFNNSHMAIPNDNDYFSTGILSDDNETSTTNDPPHHANFNTDYNGNKQPTTQHRQQSTSWNPLSAWIGPNNQ
ncbi:hypothetical protein C1645_840208 [Glomus cerebriforme]|uniref:Uncharacterized protein n=1 Tax=Glomus cerebriforme TaxID=658196 RepID=A0A397S4J2_9GLOM|nr:hypothetical protein C1645_840208 [Glomus cerebriforme]